MVHKRCKYAEICLMLYSQTFTQNDEMFAHNILGMETSQSSVRNTSSIIGNSNIILKSQSTSHWSNIGVHVTTKQIISLWKYGAIWPRGSLVLLCCVNLIQVNNNLQNACNRNLIIHCLDNAPSLQRNTRFLHYFTHVYKVTHTIHQPATTASTKSC